MCKNTKWNSPAVTQVWVAFWVLTGIMAQGVILGLSSNMVAELRSKDSPVELDINTESWLLGCVGITAMLGILVASIVMHYFGRRWANVVALVPGTLGVVFLTYGTTIPILLTARLFGGFTWGGVSVVALVVIGEYTSPEHRGMYLNLKTAVLYLGCTIAHVMGKFMYWRTAAICFIVPHLLPLVTMLTWPESPSWLAYRERYEECEKAFFSVRSPEERPELEAMISAQKEQTATQPKQTTVATDFIRIFKNLTKKNLLRPLFVNFICALLLEATGRHIFPSYGLQIIQEVTGDKSNPFYFTLIVDLSMTTSATASSVLVRFINKRTLMFLSGGFTTIVLFALCPYLYLVSANIITTNQPWIPILLMVSYFITGNIGCVPIALGLVAETFPLEHRSVGLALTGFISAACMTVILRSAPYMILYLKMYGTMALFGGLMIFSLAFIYFQLPETKDRTLQEIEHYFVHGRFESGKSIEEIEENTKIIS